MSEEGISINLIPNQEDISSYSNFDKILQKEMEIFATLDFEKKNILRLYNNNIFIFR